MKKQLFVIFLLITLSILVSCVKQGSTDGVAIDVGISEKFSNEEISSAMDSVLYKFQDFKGCKLTKLWYDEGHSNSWTKEYAEGTAIVLLSEFDVGDRGVDRSLNPNSTYTNWSWIVTREDESSSWKVIDWGY